MPTSGSSLSRTGPAPAPTPTPTRPQLPPLGGAAAGVSAPATAAVVARTADAGKNKRRTITKSTKHTKHTRAAPTPLPTHGLPCTAAAILSYPRLVCSSQHRPCPPPLRTSTLNRCTASTPQPPRVGASLATPRCPALGCMATSHTTHTTPRHTRATTTPTTPGRPPPTSPWLAQQQPPSNRTATCGPCRKCREG